MSACDLKKALPIGGFALASRAQLRSARDVKGMYTPGPTGLYASRRVAWRRRRRFRQNGRSLSASDP